MKTQDHPSAEISAQCATFSVCVEIDLLDEVFFAPELLTADDVREIMGLGAFDAVVERAQE